MLSCHSNSICWKQLWHASQMGRLMGNFRAKPELHHAPACLVQTQGMRRELIQCVRAVQTPCQKYWPELLKLIQEGTLTPYKVSHLCM